MLYVDRFSKQWIVCDPEGRFWIVPGDARAPEGQRQPFFPNGETELELVPGHYQQMLGIPN
jgi:hypothetical protein